MLNHQTLTGNPTYRSVELFGEYDASHEFVIHNRLVRELPGVHVITPLRLPEHDTAVLVNRGFVPAPDGITPVGIAFAEPGSVRVRGIAFPVPDQHDGAPLVTPQGETWRRLDLSAMRARLPYPIADYYVIAQIDSANPVAHTIRGRGYPIRIDPPPLDEGPHLSYAIQWFLIGGSIVGFGIVFVLRRGWHNPSRTDPAGTDRSLNG